MNENDSYKTELTIAEAASLVLHETGRAMHCTEIAAEIERRGLAPMRGKRSASNMNSALLAMLRHRGEELPFERLSPGIYRHRAGMEPLRYERTWYDAAVSVLREARVPLGVAEIGRRIVARGLRPVTAENKRFVALYAAFNVRVRNGTRKPLLIVKVERGRYVLREHLDTYRCEEQSQRERWIRELAVELEAQQLAAKQRALARREARLVHEKQAAPTTIGSKSWREEQMRAIREEQRGRRLRTDENLSWLDAAELVLRDAGRALHVHDIADEIVRRRLRRNPHKGARLILTTIVLASVRQERETSPFVRVAPGTYILREMVEKRGKKRKP